MPTTDPRLNTRPIGSYTDEELREMLRKWNEYFSHENIPHPMLPFSTFTIQNELAKREDFAAFMEGLEPDEVD